MFLKNKKIRIAVTTSAIGLFILTGLALKQDKSTQEIIKNLDIFTSVYRETVMLYVDNVDTKKIVKKAIDSMLAELDPYTNFIPEEEMGDFLTMTTGEYGGVGSVISLSDTNYIMVREIYPGKPAHEAGLLPGDYFLEVGGKSVVGKKVSEVSELLRGTPNTECTIKLLRDGKEINTKATRRKIQINPVQYYGMLTDEIGYIELSNFTLNCTEEVSKAFKELRDKQGAKRMILDLRGNPGGLLDEAIKLANMFLPRESHILTQRGRYISMERVMVAPKEPVDTVMPLVVLISRSSASASEIVAGSLQDWDRAVVVGQRSFGKGLVQSTREVAHGNAIKVTTAKYYIPSGRCIQALDYSQRDESGAVGYVPDSLISEFKTKRYKRKVFDGGGVSPDINVTLDTYANVSLALSAADVPFHFAVQYRRQHPKVKENYRMTDADYEEFCKFCKSFKKLKYKNKSNEALQKLVTAAKSDKYYDDNKAQFEELEKCLTPNLDKDLSLYKKEICELVENEIILGKFYRSAAIKYSLDRDKTAQVAITLLNDMPRYRGLLNGTVESHAGDKRTANKNADDKEKTDSGSDKKTPAQNKGKDKGGKKAPAKKKL